jgi:hypothetical protein
MGPWPGGVEVQDGLAAAAGDASSDVQDAVADRGRCRGGEIAVEREHRRA